MLNLGRSTSFRHTIYYTTLIKRCVPAGLFRGNRIQNVETKFIRGFNYTLFYLYFEHINGGVWRRAKTPFPYLINVKFRMFGAVSRTQ